MVVRVLLHTVLTVLLNTFEFLANKMPTEKSDKKCTFTGISSSAYLVCKINQSKPGQAKPNQTKGKPIK
jgi:hypothetical protein